MEKITEDYVSFEIAKLLKEKGFDSDVVGCHGGFYSERCYESGYGIKTQSGQEIGIVYDDLTNSDLDYDEYLRPTLQMAMKWIREQGFYINVDIDVDYDEDERGTKWYHKPAWDWFVFRIDERKQMSDDGALYATYEQAAEVAIKWCLENLI